MDLVHVGRIANPSYLEAGPQCAEKAPTGTRYFRGYVTLPKDRVIREARLLITADDSFQLFVNGKPAGAGSGYNQPQVAEITNHLTPGKNLLAVAATNASESPAGLLGKLIVTLDQGDPIVQRIDDSWKVSEKAAAGWNQPAFDESAWPNAVVVGSMGDKPWGKIEAKNMDVLGCPLFRNKKEKHDVSGNLCFWCHDLYINCRIK